MSPERAVRWARMLGYSEPQWLRLALQAGLDAAGLKKYRVEMTVPEVIVGRTVHAHDADAASASRDAERRFDRSNAAALQVSDARANRSL